MTLPFSEEIAAMRARIDAAQHAAKLDQMVRSMLTAISVVEVQHNQGLPVPEIPGDDLIDSLAVSVPGLAEIGRIGANATEYGTRLHSRRQQLELALQQLEPLVAEVKELAGRMHDLQHEQQEELEKPEWADEVAELQRLSHARDQLSAQMTPLQAQIAHVDPVSDMLLAFHPQLEAELVDAARTEDPDGRVAWRAGVMAHQMLVGLAEVLTHLGLSVALPTEPMLPDAPHPRHRRRLRAEAGAVLEWMVKLSQALSRHGRILRERLEGLKLEHDRYEQALKERMG